MRQVCWVTRITPAAPGQMLGVAQATSSQTIAQDPITIFFRNKIFLFPNKFCVLLEQLKNCSETK